MTGQNSFIIRDRIFTARPLPAGLYLVSTPIGNLADITIRALETLSCCHVVACEDTRTSGILLKHYGIDRPKVSYTEHNADTRGPDLLRQISNGAPVALISDAGTPLVSDPGFRLVQAAIEQSLPVFPVPGASAPITALVGSGFEGDDFQFCGFLPNKAKAREASLEKLKSTTSTLLFFESPRRVAASLAAMAAVFGQDRRAVVARELTKMHETFHRGTLAELCCEFEALAKVRGEIVIVVAGADEGDMRAIDAEQLLHQALETMKPGQAASQVSRLTGVSRQELYKRALALKGAS